MKTNIKIKAMICNERFILRSIEPSDAETLRIWKNQHKEYFFHKHDITINEQQSWIAALNERVNDHMFIVMDDQKPVGCIGARLYKDFVDVYNVILGDKDYMGQHIMTNALWSVVAFSNLIYSNRSVIVRVLRNNSAIKWYEKIGFSIINYFDDHVIMQFRNMYLSEKYDFNIEVTLPII